MSFGPPTHRLVLTDKRNRLNRTRAGIAWINEKGWIAIKLNPGISINTSDAEDFYFISLYPIDQQGDYHAETDKPDKVETNAEFGNDDVPF
jgi:hypothetical protein